MPPEIDPGGYIEEIPGGLPPITGVSTSAAFVGFFAEGPLNTPVRITSPKDFESQFGPFDGRNVDSCAIQLYFQNGGKSAWVVRAASRKPDASALIAGMQQLAETAPGPFNLLCLPSAADLQKADGSLDEDNIIRVYTEAEAFCEAHHAFLIVDISQAAGQSLQNFKVWLADIGDRLRHKNAAVYFPRLIIPGPLRKNTLRSVPSSGAVASVYAHTDAAGGVWIAPEGPQAPLQNVNLSVQLDDQDIDDLDHLGINTLRSLPGNGIVVWGARTFIEVNTQEDEWKYVSLRRLILYLEESLDRGLQWAVFEPDDEPLWSKIRLSVEDFLYGLWRAGALLGSKPEEAYFVKCGRDTMTQNDIEQGIVNVIVGFAPIKPAEFIIIRIQQRCAAA